MRLTLRLRPRRVVLGWAALAVLAACSSTTAGSPQSGASSGSRANTPAPASSAMPTRPSTSIPPSAGAAFPDPERVQGLLAAVGADLVLINEYDYRQLDRYRKAALWGTIEPLTTNLG